MRPRPAVEAHHFEALGTSCSLFGLGVSQTQLLKGEFWVRELGARITRFSDRSELAALNQSDGAWVDVSAETEELLRESLRRTSLAPAWSTSRYCRRCWPSARRGRWRKARRAPHRSAPHRRPRSRMCSACSLDAHDCNGAAGSTSAASPKAGWRTGWL